MKSIKVIFFGVIIFGLALWLGSEAIKEFRYQFTKKDWRLEVYKSSNPDKVYLEIIIPGYATKSNCIEKGFELTRTHGSFQCSFACGLTRDFRDEDDVCDVICTKSGCRE